MLFRVLVNPLPIITEIAQFVRKTTWRCADKRNILVFVQDGACSFTLDGQTLLLHKGEALLIPAEVPHIRKPHGDKSCTLCYVHFLTAKPIVAVEEDRLHAELSDILQDTARDLIAPAEQFHAAARQVYLSQKMNLGEEIDAVFTQLQTMAEEGFQRVDLFSSFGIALSFTQLLVTLSRKTIAEFHAPLLQKSSGVPLPLQKALLYVQKNYQQKITVTALADAVGVTPQHIIRLFRKHLNITPLTYINRTKILHAIDMLRNSGRSVQEIAYELGFDNPNYFSRLFKKEEKMTPHETRNRIHNYNKEQIPSPVQE